MITEFQDGFITKTKLNELVRGINANKNSVSNMTGTVSNMTGTVSNMTGTVLFFAGAVVPNGYLEMNGAEVSRTLYSSLFSVIGTQYGAGDGSTTFSLPDVRGYFPRFLDSGAGVDTGRTLGSIQSDQNKSHTHSGTVDSSGNHTHAITDLGGNGEDERQAKPSASDIGNTGWTYTTGASGSHTHTYTTSSNGGTEVRVKNIAFMGIIKY